MIADAASAAGSPNWSRRHEYAGATLRAVLGNFAREDVRTRDGGIMPIGFVRAGMRFFAVSLVAALFVIALAPLGPVRLLGAIALACAAAGFMLHLYALHLDDPRAFAALSLRLRSLLVRAQAAEG